VPASDQLAKTTLYWIASTQGGVTTLYNGTIWRTVPMSSGASIAVPNTSNQMYDVFAYLDTGDVVAIELVAWTNDTTRATAIAGQDGIAVKSGDPTRLYVGSFRTTGTSGQTEDSEKKRLVYNRFNRWPRSIRVTDATASWTYNPSPSAYRQANANTANQFEMVVGFTDVFIDISVYAKHQHATQGVTRLAGIGFDSTTANSATEYGNMAGGTSVFQMSQARFCGQRTDKNYQIYVWLEFAANNALTSTFFGGVNSGIQGWVLI
jgi:hypothetical protein